VSVSRLDDFQLVTLAPSLPFGEESLDHVRPFTGFARAQRSSLPVVLLGGGGGPSRLVGVSNQDVWLQKTQALTIPSGFLPPV